jgi:hypothetical protein
MVLRGGGEVETTNADANHLDGEWRPPALDKATYVESCTPEQGVVRVNEFLVENMHLPADGVMVAAEVI